MNTPLQHAVWAVIARWESPAWKDMPHTGEYIDAMRKALADEQAQAVEPVGYVYWVKGHAEGALDDQSLKPGTPLFTHPAPPPAGEQIDWQDMHLSEILAEKGITLQKTFVEKPRDHVGDATAMVGRIEFIQKLRDRIAYLHEIGVNDTPVLLEEAAAMLEADAREIEGMECDYTDQVMRAIAAEEKLAQQVAVPAKREPLSRDQILDGFCKAPDCRQYVTSFKAGVEFAEAHHGITQGHKS